MYPIQITSLDTPRDEWLKARRSGIGASDIAMTMGLSPYGTEFSLYWDKIMPSDDTNTDLTATGRHLEPSIADWWNSQNDDHQITRTGMWKSSERNWQLATPDRLVYPNCPICNGDKNVTQAMSRYNVSANVEFPCLACAGRGFNEIKPVAVLECKWVAYSWDGWGEPGTNEIPVHYACQVQWQMDVMNVDVAYVAALGPGGFRAYEVHRDTADITVLREYGQRFWDRVLTDDAPPIDDGHPATTETLKRIHPTLSDETVEIPVDLAEAWRRSRSLAKRSDDLTKRLENRIRQTMGTARRSECNGHLVISRSIIEASTDLAELDALDTDRQTTDRITPGRAKDYRVPNPKRRR